MPRTGHGSLVHQAARQFTRGGEANADADPGRNALLQLTLQVSNPERLPQVVIGPELALVVRTGCGKPDPGSWH